MSSLTTKGEPVTISQFSDYLATQIFICADDVFAGSPTHVLPGAMAVRHGGRGDLRGACSGRAQRGSHGNRFQRNGSKG